MARIPIADLATQHAPLEDELGAAFLRVLKSGRFILGSEVAALEDEVAKLHGVRHAIGVSSGTDALLAVLMALGVGPGDEVVMPALSFFATAGAVLRLGARPIFGDIGDDFLMSPEEAQRLVGPRTRAVIVVHLFGRVAPIPRVNVPIIEDAAQAFDAGNVGHLGTAACLSFFPTKNLGALGDAGMILCQEDRLADQLRQIRVHGQPRKYEHAILGGNFRLDELQAALLRVKLPHLRGWNAKRRGNAARYRQQLADLPLGLPAFAEGDVVHHFNVRTSKRDPLRAHLTAAEIETDIYYPAPMYAHSAYTGPPQSCPRAEAIVRECLALPVHAELSDEQHSRVVATVREFFRG